MFCLSRTVGSGTSFLCQCFVLLGQYFDILKFAEGEFDPATEGSPERTKKAEAARER